MRAEARELMDKAPIAISLQRKLAEIVAFQSNNPLYAVPVLDQRGLLVGVLTDLSLVKMQLIASSRGELDERLISYSHLLQRAEFVQECNDLNQVIKKLVKAEHRQIYVVDEKGFLKGMITPKSILKYFDQKSSNDKIHRSHLPAN